MGSKGLKKKELAVWCRKDAKVGEMENRSGMGDLPFLGKTCRKIAKARELQEKSRKK